MKIIQEATVRQMFFRQHLREIHVEEDTFITSQAKEYMREKGIRLIVDKPQQESLDNVDKPHQESATNNNTTNTTRDVQVAKPENVSGTTEVNYDIRPPQETGGYKYTTLDNQKLNEKPEHMTHLYGNLLVCKNHPRIVLRGKLDSLEAKIIEVQVIALQQGYSSLCDDLTELLNYCRSILGSEVTGKPLDDIKLLGLTEAEQRSISHNPKKYYGTGHILPGHTLGIIGVSLNLLRTQSREVELSAVEAFTENGVLIGRKDILQAMNRISSVFYILMCRFVSGYYHKDSE